MMRQQENSYWSVGANISPPRPSLPPRYSRLRIPSTMPDIVNILSACGAAGHLDQTGLRDWQRSIWGDLCRGHSGYTAGVTGLPGLSPSHHHLPFPHLPSPHLTKLSDWVTVLPGERRGGWSVVMSDNNREKGWQYVSPSWPWQPPGLWPSQPSHNWRKYADLWDLCWHLGLAGGARQQELRERTEKYPGWEWSRGGLDGVWDGCDGCDGCDVLQTPLTSSPLITSHLNTLSIHHCSL